MKLKRIIFSGIFWRGSYFITVLLLNIVVSRYFKASGSGWIYYITNYFSFFILLASLSLESGMSFFAANDKIRINKLATFSLFWSAAISLLVSFFLYQRQPAVSTENSRFFFLAITYTSGSLLTGFFCALFYAQQNYALPSTVLASCNLALIVTILYYVWTGNGGNTADFFLQIYFFNFLLQGIVLSVAYFVNNKILLRWAFPKLSELKLLFRYSLLAFFNNMLFFLIYRVDYWFVKNTCIHCMEGDLGNYIQVSKIGQLFLLLPVILAGAIFPLTASGFKAEINNGLPVLARMVTVFYVAVLALLALVGQRLFPWVYGQTFDRMYLPFVLLIPGILSLSTIALLTAYNSGKNKMGINMRGSLIGLAVIVTGDWLLIPRYGIAAAALVSSAGYISYLCYLVYAFNKEYHIPATHFFIPVKSDVKRLQQIFQRHQGD